MFQRQKNWISDVLWKPKKAHSLEQLRYNNRVMFSLLHVSSELVSGCSILPRTLNDF